MRYKSIVVTLRGGLEILQMKENDLRAPSPGEARIKIQATPVCQDDVALRIGNRPFQVKTPFVLGYSILGVVYTGGEDVSQMSVGERVAALTTLGGQAECIYLDEGKLVHVPGGLGFVYNGMGEEYLRAGLLVLRRGGVPVYYGAPKSFLCFLLFLVEFILFNLLPNGKTIKGYGTHRIGVELFEQDWMILFQQPCEGKIRPIIYGRYPLLEAARAYELLEGGQVIGNVVLLA